jgi:hypothetical protein
MTLEDEEQTDSEARKIGQVSDQRPRRDSALRIGARLLRNRNETATSRATIPMTVDRPLICRIS